MWGRVVAGPKRGAPQLGTMDVWGRVILRVGGCPVHCGMFSCISGLYPLDASRNVPHPVMTTKIAPNIARCPQGSNITLAENHGIPVKRTALKRWDPGLSHWLCCYPEHVTQHLQALVSSSVKWT